MNNNTAIADIKQLSKQISESVTRLTGLEEKDVDIEHDETIPSKSKLLNEIASLALEISTFAQNFRHQAVEDLDDSGLEPDITRPTAEECPCCKIS